MTAQTMPTIWIVADHEGNPLRAEVSQRMLGPFAYSKRESAEAAASDPSTLLGRSEGGLCIQEVTGVGFIQNIISTFTDKGSDVFVLDEGLYPFTTEGAAWVDEFRSNGEWAPVFIRNPETPARINKVLARISSALGVGEIRVQAGAGARAQECQDLISEHVIIEMTPENPQGTADGFLRGDSTFWIHTVGMAHLDRPDLEMRGVPAYFVRTAGTSLNAWAAFSIDNEIQGGQMLQDGGETLPIGLVAVPSADPYWADRNGCLCLTVAKVMVPVDMPDRPVLH